MLADNREIIIESDVSAIHQAEFDFKSFTFHFQPIFCLKTNKVVMYEALLRSRQFASISIEELVIDVISSGKSDQLTLLTLEAIRPYVSDPKFNDVKFTVNLEPAQVASEGFKLLVNYYFRKFKIDMTRVIFEITERPCSHKMFNDVLVNTNSMTANGYLFAIDDFGTGVSNFEMLCELDVYMIKLDGNFGIKSLHDINCQKVFKFVSTFNESFGCKVCAEGLETEEHVELARGLGFCFGQGYGLGMPKVLTGIVE
ncbi:MAG: EAL domain-containing protein [Pseudoalteromonas sp.]|uniref:EAL domain-containing protein n=1 Tax=Pseudoalteromonas sp. TaxID=53249 RepID=UPI001D485551|nr:EAL domain-containing protein [Pseudoalteromonas sp.]MCH2088578.1 EAL domain-containing protein [Pseudoalteromonas sp.]NRA82018.1 EAL domain-containing protein [Pseudoalteromonas sp.]